LSRQFNRGATLVALKRVGGRRCYPGEHGSKLPNPAPRRLVGDLDAELGKQVLNVTVAQREAEIEPDRVHDPNAIDTLRFGMSVAFV
jgi:hypothetical protein